MTKPAFRLWNPGSQQAHAAGRALWASWRSRPALSGGAGMSAAPQIRG